MEQRCQKVEVKPVVEPDIETDIQMTEDKVREEGDFKVYINEGEMERIHEWVELKSDIETGGDLFGLWIDEYTAVVQFVIGPGKKCRRTKTSFFQDTDYLGRTGEYLTKQHGLCNIGQWHSHHKMQLFVPSAGDCKTVSENMPVSGRYIVFIANITNTNAEVNCFLFGLRIGQKVPFQQGKLEKLPGESPLRLNTSVLEIINDSAEYLRDEDRFFKSTDKSTEIKMQNETGKIHQITEADLTTPVDRKNNDKNTTTNNNDKSTKRNNSEEIELAILPSASLPSMKDARPQKNMNTPNEQYSTANEEKESSHHVKSAVIDQPTSVESDKDRNSSNIIANRDTPANGLSGIWEFIQGLFSTCRNKRGSYNMG